MTIKDKMSSGPTLGFFSKTTDSALVEAAGLSGMDFIIIDQEHGTVTSETLHHHVRAAQLSGIATIVRVSDTNAHAIGAALDSGASGVQVPNINTKKQAQNAVDAARFHPMGQRGVCRFVRAANYGSKERNQYFSDANNTALILQVEGKEGVKNLDSILEVQGFDILFVGPYDLSQSVGKPGEIDAPEVMKLIKEISKKAKEKNIMLGAFCDTEANAKLLLDEGFRYIAYSVDINIFIEACSRLKRKLL